MIESWYEVYKFSWEIDIEWSINRIQKLLSKRRPEKYEKFLKNLNKIKILLKIAWVPDVENRVKLMKYIYYAMRLLDDSFDWDTPIILDDTSKRRLASFSLGDSEADENQLFSALMLEITRLSNLLWIFEQVNFSLRQIITSLVFDVDRILDWKHIVLKSDLSENFHKMDIEGTIWGTALVFWIDVSQTIELLRELWDATRIWYTLEDLSSDINSWIINIPKEDFEEFSIELAELYDFANLWIISGWLRNWLLAQIHEIDRLLWMHFQKINQKNIDVTYSPKWWWTYRVKLYNMLLKRKTLKWYIDETLQTRQKVMRLLSN